MTQISTRMLIEAAEKIACGFSFQVACKFAVENHFSSEGGSDDSERVRIRQIIQKNGVWGLPPRRYECYTYASCT